ncbi:MAG: DNA-directed RNA polymerase subunit omega [Clostridia bacterium]|nr:DNA-directed RNA polymerase subunit omega [Clostridia bacterium]MBQ3563899.1 DNA-directed RNA polymerase subunit omega [Clostridia bacterium]MBQ5717186.1 DNA-directed RNA polymerase subunit omega [Clostridia bacterium]MBQ5890082.1 DNA-directed RNA polymerase subunit omega [Clostridia bacterium]MBQ9846582.1 DNA-directed RNA polymerase subunit omega [Clostridia bacterium]
MLNPAIGKLINNYENRYQLVHDVANKAREIAQNAEDNNEILVEKTVSLAINELAEQKGL